MINNLKGVIMVVKLTAKQVVENWRYIKKAFEDNPHLIDKDVMDMFFSGMMNDKIQTWFSMDGDKPKGFLTTYIMKHDMGVRNVLVVGTAVSYDMGDEDWEKMFLALKEFASKSNCSHMLAFTESEALFKRVHKFSKPKVQVALTWEV
jgi:hypothetical protein